MSDTVSLRYYRTDNTREHAMFRWRHSDEEEVVVVYIYVLNSDRMHLQYDASPICNSHCNTLTKIGRWLQYIHKSDLYPQRHDFTKTMGASMKTIATTHYCCDSFLIN